MNYELFLYPNSLLLLFTLTLYSYSLLLLFTLYSLLFTLYSLLFTLYSLLFPWEMFGYFIQHNTEGYHHIEAHIDSPHRHLSYVITHS